MFSIHEVLEALVPILDINLVVTSKEGVNIIDSVNNFGFSLDYPEGITIFFYGEHFHLWKFSGDDTITYDDILEQFVSFVNRLLTNRILFVYTFRGGELTRIKISEFDNEESVIAEYLTSLNPLLLFFRKKENREVVEFKQR